MRIHRVKLLNFRGVREAEIEFPAEGVTIIEGDNEVGKTSVSEAVDLVLSERDDSSKRQVRAVRPVGRDVGAEVEIELSTGPYRFSLRKRWHRQRETVLQVFEPKKFQLTGREAHDKAREILEETLDSALWEALHLRQGAELHQAAFAGGSLGRALDITSGSATGTDDDLWERITAQRDRYWTATGHPKVERVNAEGSVSQARSKVGDLEALLAALEKDAEEVARLASEAKVLAERMADQGEIETDLAQRAQKIQQYRNNLIVVSGKHETAVAQQEKAASARAQRDELANRSANAAAIAEDLTAQVAEAAPFRQQAEDAVTLAKENLRTAKERVEAAEDQLRQASADRDFRRQEIEFAQLTERHDRVVDALSGRAAAEAVLEANPVDAERLRNIEQAHVALVVAEAAVSTGATKVSATALSDVELIVDGEAFPLPSGDAHEVVVTTSTEILVPGKLRVTVVAGAEAQTLAEQMTAAREVFESACEECGVIGLAEAREAATARAEAERKLAESAKTISQDLRDLTADEIAGKVEKLKARVSSFEAQRQSETAIPVDLNEADRRVIEHEDTLRDAKDEVVRCEADLERATSALQDLSKVNASLAARLEQARQIESDERLALESARELVADDVLSEQLATAQANLEESLAVMEGVRRQLTAEDPDTVDELLHNARDAKSRLGDELHANEMRVQELRATLAVKGEEGLASKLDFAQTELVRLQVAYEQLERRAAAAKLLYDTFAARRAEAHQRYVAPFRESIEKLGRLVFGLTFEVELDDELRVARRSLDGVTLDFDDLSTGAKEQLGMISRLACASIVATDGGAPVIFDDALGWSDPRRLDRMGAVISSAGRSCQIIVLTCTPGRYASVGNARVVQLPV